MTQLTAGKPLRVFFYTLLIIIVLIQIYPIFLGNKLQLEDIGGIGSGVVYPSP